MSVIRNAFIQKLTSFACCFSRWSFPSSCASACSTRCPSYTRPSTTGSVRSLRKPDRTAQTLRRRQSRGSAASRPQKLRPGKRHNSSAPPSSVQRTCTRSRRPACCTRPWAFQACRTFGCTPIGCGIRHTRVFCC